MDVLQNQAGWFGEEANLAHTGNKTMNPIKDIT
jgi:hypothetical protein